jgi:hypothetical protein
VNNTTAQDQNKEERREKHTLLAVNEQLQGMADLSINELQQGMLVARRS